MIERMKMDMEVDIYQTVKQIRINRPHLVKNVVSGDLKFVHCLLSSLHSCLSYVVTSAH